jgi:hypothetical protein
VSEEKNFDRARSFVQIVLQWVIMWTRPGERKRDCRGESKQSGGSIPGEIRRVVVFPGGKGGGEGKNVFRCFTSLSNFHYPKFLKLDLSKRNTPVTWPISVLGWFRPTRVVVMKD